MKVLAISKEEVRFILNMEICVELMKEAFRYQSEGSIVQPLRLPMWLTPEKNSLLGLMPGSINNSVFGVKVISLFYNAADSHQGAILLFDGQDGKLLSIISGSEVTGIRTAACTAGPIFFFQEFALKFLKSLVATSLLVPSEKKELTCTILGTGLQARLHISSMFVVLGDRLKVVRIWGRNYEKAKGLVQEFQNQFPFQLEAIESIELAVQTADVITTTTSSADPILFGKWIEPGSHINVIGSRIEVDSECIIKSSVFVDSKLSALNEAKDILQLISEGLIPTSHIQAEIGNILLGQHPGRTSSTQITLFRSLGIAVEDLVASNYIYKIANIKKFGTYIDL